MLPSHLVCRERPNSKEKIKSRTIEEKSKEQLSKQSAEEVKKKKYSLKKSKELSRSQEKSQDKTQEKSSENAKSKLSKEKIKGGTGGKSKEKNSSGYKRSSTSTGQSVMSSLNTDLFIEDLTRTKEMKKKSIINTLFYLMFSIFLLYFGYGQQYKYGDIEQKNEISFATVYPSVTHYKMSILSDETEQSRNIRDIYMGIGASENYQREAAIYHAYAFKAFLSNKIDVSTGFSLQTSLFAYGFVGDEFTNDVGPLIVHDAYLTPVDLTSYLDFGSVLTFSTLGNDNSSLFSKKIDAKFFATMADSYFGQNVENADGGNEMTGRQDNFISAAAQGIPTRTSESNTYFHYSTADPRVNISSLPFSSIKKFGHLQFASSGPKTLGTIAEIAIQLALSKINGAHRIKAQIVDLYIAQALSCTLSAVASQKDGSFMDLTLLDGTKEYPCWQRAEVKLQTNGVLTSNILFLDNRDGWPTVMHFATSTNGSVHLESNGKNSTGLLNVCQVVVRKNGYLWLTAAASGEFYLLEKVVSSIVHKIVLNTDPLSLLAKPKRYRYDLQTGNIISEKYKTNNVKEVLQFAVYNSEHNRFRSWVEQSNETTIASGY